MGHRYLRYPCPTSIHVRLALDKFKCIMDKRCPPSGIQPQSTRTRILCAFLRQKSSPINRVKVRSSHTLRRFARDTVKATVPHHHDYSSNPNKTPNIISIGDFLGLLRHLGNIQNQQTSELEHQLLLVAAAITYTRMHAPQPSHQPAATLPPATHTLASSCTQIVASSFTTLCLILAQVMVIELCQATLMRRVRGSNDFVSGIEYSAAFT